MKHYFIYMVECSDGSLYTGWTVDLEKRVAKHNDGTGSKYTRSKLPVTLVWHYDAGSISAALRLEHSVKKLTRAEKLLLIQGDRELP